MPAFHHKKSPASLNGLTVKPLKPRFTASPTRRGSWRQVALLASLLAAGACTRQPKETWDYTKERTVRFKMIPAPEWMRQREADARAGFLTSPFRLERDMILSLTLMQDAAYAKESKYRVGPDGMVDFPLIGRLTVEGLTPAELKGLLTEKLSRFYRNPEMVLNLEPATLDRPDTSTSVAVFGESKGSGLYTYTGRKTVIDAIASSGGFSADSNWRSVGVIRRWKGEDVIIVVDAEALFKRGDLRQNISLENGDILYIPREPDTMGERFLHDWDLFIHYMSGIQQTDGAYQQFDGRFRR
ncbi:MAG: polysaccharide biosynthesis/export family protein [Planctomycetota bacterium]